MASEFKNTEAFIRKYGKSVESEIQTRLINSGKYASGGLYKSLRTEVKEEKGDFILRFYFVNPGKEYAAFVDKGVTGAGIPQKFGGLKKKVNKGQFDKDAGRIHAFGKKMPPNNKSIRNWMTIKGLPKEAGFAIRRSIWIFGIAPTNFFTIPTTRRQKQFEAGIEKSMALDFEQIILKGLK
jgi:hypothetical protein